MQDVLLTRDINEQKLNRNRYSEASSISITSSSFFSV